MLELQPGKVWAPCLCDEVDPSDRPCIVCEVWISHRQIPPPEVKARYTYKDFEEKEND